MKLMEELKSHSSKWIKTKGTGYENFYWQDGYGAFSVNPADVDTVIRYIANQHKHHSKKIFQDEYRAILKKIMLIMTKSMFGIDTSTIQRFEFYGL